MALTLSEFIAREFGTESVDSVLLKLGSKDTVSFPQAQLAYFHLVLSGAATIRLEGNEVIQLRAGDFVLMLYGAPHLLSSPSIKRVRVTQTVNQWAALDEPATVDLAGGSAMEAQVLSGQLQFTRTPRSSPIFRALPHVLRYGPPPGADVDVDGTVLVARLAHIERSCHGPGAALFVHSIVQLHVVQVLRQIYEEITETFPVHLGAPDMTRMTALLRKIRRHPEKRWTVASLAQEMGWSRSSFAAKFAAYAGKGPIHFVTHTRMIEATSLLRSNPDLPVWQVARRVGYEAQSSFTRAFKAQFRMTPRKYAAKLADTAGPARHVQKVLMESASNGTSASPESWSRTSHVMERS